MYREYHDMAGNYALQPQGVTLATLGVPPYLPPAEDWEDEYPAPSGRADGFGPDVSRFGAMPPAGSEMEAPGAGISFADLVRTISPSAEFEVWRDDNNAPRYAGWDNSQRYAVPYDPRAAALGALRIAGLPEDAAEWSWHERSPGRASGPEMPAQLASMLNRLLGLELGTEYTPSRRGGYPSISGGGGGGGGSSAPRGTPPSVSGPIYRSGKPKERDLTPRPGEDHLSAWETLSNRYPTPPGEQPVFRPGKPYMEIDPSKLPPGSVRPDRVPAGHVSISRSVPWKTILEAIIGKGKFPK